MTSEEIRKREETVFEYTQDGYTVGQLAKFYHVEPPSVYRALRNAVERSKSNDPWVGDMAYSDIRRSAMIRKTLILIALGMGTRAISRVLGRSVTTIDRWRKNGEGWGNTGIRIEVTGDGVVDEDGKPLEQTGYTVYPMNDKHGFLRRLDTGKGYHVVLYENLRGKWSLISPYIYELAG